VTTPILVEAMKGLGDSIYQRPFIRAAAARGPVWIATPWPELYSDLPVQFAPMVTILRTQARNLARQSPDRFSAPPRHARRVRMGYGHKLSRSSIIRCLEENLPLDGAELVFDLPAELRRPWLAGRRPIALVRPVTVRSEWRNEARNPLPAYVSRLAARLMASHHVITVADLQPGAEWLDGPPVPAHTRFERGELDVSLLMRLIAQADLVIGGVGFLLPAAIAQATPAFIVQGGHGAHNAPERITDPRLDTSRIGFARPDRFCVCDKMLHRCEKTISDLDERFETWARALSLKV
jgi:hypothetical protein